MFDGTDLYFFSSQYLGMCKFVTGRAMLKRQHSVRRRYKLTLGPTVLFP